MKLMKLVKTGNLSVVEQEGGYVYSGVLIDGKSLGDIILTEINDEIDMSKEVIELGNAVVVIEINMSKFGV